VRVLVIVLDRFPFLLTERAKIEDEHDRRESAKDSGRVRLRPNRGFQGGHALDANP
jgi:hypothetical protein